MEADERPQSHPEISGAGRVRECRCRLKYGPALLAVLLLATVTSYAAEDVIDPDFVQSLIRTDFRVDGHLSLAIGAGETVLVLMGRQEDQTRIMAIFPVHADGRAGPPLARFELPANFVFYDRPARPAPPAVVFLATDGIWQYEVGAHRLLRLLDTSSLYRGVLDGRLEPFDFLLDVNGDGRDDILVPDFEGYRLYLRHEDREPAAGVLLKAPVRMQLVERVHLPRGVPRYRRYIPFNLDLTGDGKPDLGVVSEGSLLIFAQDEEGRLNDDPRVLELNLDLTPEYLSGALDSDEMDVDHSRLQVRQVQDVRDLNGDGIADVVVQTTLSSGLLDKRTEYQVHMGRIEKNELRFRREPDSIVASDGFQFYLTKTDINADERLDLISPSVSFGVRQIITALFTSRVGMEVAFYAMGPDAIYPSEPTVKKDLSVRFELSTGYVDWPALGVADFNGDGVADLLIQHGADELRIHAGTGDSSLFSDEATQIRTALPRDGEGVSAVDIDADGRHDLLMQYTSADGGDGARQVRVLMNR